MPSPLDQVTYNQDAGYLPVNLVSGDDLPISIAFGFDVSTYVFSGAVLDSLGNVLEAFTVTGPVFTAPSTWTITVSLATLQTSIIPSGARYYLQWVGNGLTRTFLSGPISAVSK